MYGAVSCPKLRPVSPPTKSSAASPRRGRSVILSADHVCSGVTGSLRRNLGWGSARSRRISVRMEQTMPSKPRIPTDEELRRITTRAVAEIVPQREFVDGLRSGRRLRLKMGFDPTKPLITLGWAGGLRKLRQLQDLGHTVVVIIGVWTARIGDPSGQSRTRSMLTAEEVQANSEAILRQFYKVLDESRTEIRRQSEWFDGF